MGQAGTLRAALLALALLAPATGWTASAAVTEARAMVERGQLEQALRHLEEHLRSAPQDAEARFTRGLVLVRLNRSDDAIEAFKGLTKDYPQLPEPYNNLAVIYAQQGDYEKARDALEAALATHPSYGVAHENLGDIYAALAAAAYNRALTLDQGNSAVRAKLNLINQLDSLGDARGVTSSVAQAPTPEAQQAPEPEPPAAQPAAAPSQPEPPAAQPAAAPSQPEPPAAKAAAAPAPVEEKPAPAQPAAPPPPAGLDKAAVEAAVQAWAKAWSDQDLDAYLGAYAPDFDPREGLSRPAWEEQRRQRVGSPKKIIVQVSDLRIEPMDGNKAKATFKQYYESNLLTNRATKVLEMGKVQDQWKILREYTR